MFKDMRLNKPLLLLCALAALVVAAVSCRRDIVINEQNSYVNFDTQCLGSNMDGTMRVKAWGSGATRAKAIENARRNALRDVIFKGISGGSAECNSAPLTYEVNARERYQYYFDAFFADGGAYTSYTSLDDETLTGRTQAKGLVQQSYGVVVTVNRTALRQRLINDGIIKP